MNVFKNISVLLSKNMLFQLRKIKGKNIKEIGQILWNQFYWSPDTFFKKNMLTPHAMKTHIQISYKECKSERRRCVQGL